MNRLLLPAIVMTACCAAAYAQLPNLLEGCVTDNETQMDSRTAFFSVWQSYYEDGEALPAELQPNSVFSIIRASGNALYFHYNGSTRNVPGDVSNGFTADLPVVILDFPTNIYPYDFSGLCYSYPISVPESGLYHLTGSAICLSANNLNGQPKSFVNTASMIVFTGDRVPCAKTMTIEQRGDENYLAVRNPQNETVPSAYLPIPAYRPGVNTQPFDLTIELTTDTHYLSIYGPMQQIMFGNLKLIPDKIPASIHTVAEPSQPSTNNGDMQGHNSIYTLQGIPTTMEQARQTGGLFIITGSEGSRKFIVR